MSRARRWASAACLAIVVTVPAVGAWGCVPYGPALELDRRQASPGDTVTLKGTGFNRTEPVIVRFNALNGPVLATLAAAGGNVSGTFTVPNTPPGSYVILVDHEEPLGKILFQPVRAALTVVSPGGGQPVVGSVPPQRPRIPALAGGSNGVDAGLVALVALGVGGAALFVLGLSTVSVSRRPSQSAVEVKK